MALDETSDRIKRAALDRFVEVGYGSSTVDEIAAAAGVGVATLYRRWPDKAAIANDLLLDYLDAFDVILEPNESGNRKTRFLALWARIWEQAALDPQRLLFFEAQSHAGFLTDEMTARKEAAAQRWMIAISDLGIGADPTTATSLIVGSLTAAWRNGFEIDPDDLGQRLWAALRP